jgi:hypothetical protein
MLLRSASGVIHLLLAASFLFTGLMFAAEGRLNLKWEAHFYGSPSLPSLRMLMMGFSGIGIALVQASTATLYTVTGNRLLGHLVFMGSAFLALVLPLPIGLLPMLAAAAVMLDLWPRFPPADESAEP